MTDYTPEYTESLGNLMNAVLDSVISVFEQASIPLPEKRYIAMGQTIHDCEQVTVSLTQLYLGPPGDEAASPQRCDSPRTAVLVVEIVRCVPTAGRSGAPTEAQLQEYAQARAADAYMLLEAGANAVDTWGLGVMADVTPGQASGGMQAMTMNVVVAVP